MTPLSELAADIVSRFGFRPVVGVEYEFYLAPCEQAKPLDDFCALVAAHPGLPPGFDQISRERGEHQFEFSLHPSSDLEGMAGHMEQARAIVGIVANALGWRPVFAAKPFIDQPACGLHVHVHLEDTEGRNIFYKDDKAISESLKYSLGGLLATMIQHMPVFAPTEASYARYADRREVPKTVSWGANNRTVALRLPETMPGMPKRIEHRVAGADADMAAVLACILKGICYGLAEHSDPGTQIYGDASLPDYQLERLPTSLAEAMQRAEMTSCHAINSP